ncbi:MAG: folate-binding protein YgfZ [Aestuariivirga sp.]|uniref:CAF17-like 4Fe-4S cluster assembly/insertion protein YgfZ n=1 Tax=Aestuariivirga sp. TaxID=2650926 RepID=UPI0025C16280|nr:folate-binding protein YgfZ [Aestuariivirga sp.]MCA3559403.1 folate-binding protein YgfZ [Aestuariivirga sp.]
MRDIEFQAGTLPGRAVIAVRGPEAGHFLHNLLTADIDRLAEGEAAYAALLTPQGKILFDMLVLRGADSYLIDCAAGQRADLLKRLSMYKLRAKVEIAARDDLAAGASPIELAGGYRDPRSPGIGWRVIGAPQAEARGYDAARIAAGLADSEADLGSGEFFPHEANLDQLGGVNFRKGCYVGQEVVSRMEHRGTARSRILPVTVDGTMPPKGTEIRAGEKQVGTLLSSAGQKALALIRLDRLADATAPLVADGATVTVKKPAWATYEVPGAA